MTILPVLQVPNPILLSTASPVEIFDEALAKFANDLSDTMLGRNLIGLSAVQVAVLQNVIVVDFGNDEQHNPKVFVNPKIKYFPEQGKSWEYEGCGSMPNVFYNVERVNVILLTAQTILGENLELKLVGHLARCVLHEENHNRGILINKIGRDRKIVK